ncbi:unnamed protein product [Phytophthora lilii]|uniref:Unnamed protein product n=1 Tax=Phytophthora lilii TaxID=2077276 RepID=A0A9W7CMU9_9STRA|nr:unnamed protein product [Phytophthora lilii]
MPPQHCNAIGNYKTGAVCGEPVWSGADGRAVCEAHNLRAVDNERQCQANQIKYPALRCPNKARGGGSRFCMRQHAGLYVGPEKFRKKYLRSTTRDAEVTADEQQNVDVYLGNTLATNCWEDGRTYQLDHVVECQAVAEVFGQLIFPSDRAEKKCTAILFNATTDRANLRLTATWANAVKEVAESDFLDDWVLEEGGPKPFRHYVAAAVKNGRRFDPADVQRVCAEVKRGLRQFMEAVMRQFEDAGKKAGKTKKTEWAKQLEELSIQVKKQLKALYKAHQFSKKPRRRHSTGSVTPLLSLGRGRASASSASKSSSKARAKTSASARNAAQQAEASPRKTPRRRTASARGSRS